MKGYVLISVLMAMLFSPAVFSQEPEEAIRPEENMERQMHQRNMQLELQKRHSDLDFHRRMQDLQLEKQKVALEHERKSLERPALQRPAWFAHPHKAEILPFPPVCFIAGMLLFLIACFVCFVIHILLAVWVYGDIRQRGTGSGIWIVIVLLTGLFGVLPYTIVRLGEIRQTK